MAVFGARLKEARKAKGLTQQQLADALQLPRTSITSYETTSREPDFTMLVRMAELLGVSVEYLTGASLDTPQRFSELADLFSSLRDVYEVAPDELRQLSDNLLREAQALITAAIGKGNPDALRSTIEILRNLRAMF